MSSSGTIAPPEEQKICISCGFCCNGTLFLFAHLDPGERGSLPERIEKNSYSEKGKDYFRLPCEYFSGKCTIYNLERAHICGSYRCQLLKDYAGGKMTLQTAQEVIRSAKKMHSDGIENYRYLSGNQEKIFFRQLLSELGKIQNSVAERNLVNTDYELLLARCNIFEALLIRHFRSADDFEKIMQ
jgi:hypothetical protein